MNAPISTREPQNRTARAGCSQGEGCRIPTVAQDGRLLAAANYLSPVGQIYLYDNPLLREPLTLAHVKPLVVGHWGTTPGKTLFMCIEQGHQEV